ncbi:FecR domain-containing protein (plasmid) [Sphingobium sp. V4]|uniref:FecR family protein n=1 Tax=Sphingobium sp. V4 TaxID=3038927 RepID=UPI0025582C61|nr:FecR domain-containing protein [Sphingobium sp. V4]WIW90358.1 FecR domain-containing protein [Sphingobium sp. V4]
MGSASQDGPPFPGRIPGQAEEAALGWAIALRDSPDDLSLRRQFQAWHEADAMHRQAWAAMRHLDDRLEQVEPAYAVRADNRHMVLPAVETPPKRLRRPLLLAAGAACLALLLAPAVSLRLQADYRTGVAEVERVTLADGSVVQLAPRSAIAVDFAAGRRDIRLMEGEAFFAVTRNPSRPFRVLGDRATVTVLGTAFDVRAARGDDDAALVGVEHGRVRVAPHAGAPMLLTAGQGAAVAASGDLRRQAVVPTQIAAWRDRQIIVRNEPITDAIDRLRPWFGGMILTRGEALANQRLTGLFNAADPVEALRGMARAYGGRVTVIGGWLIIYSQA